MPTYGYACDECGHEFEEFHSIKAKPLRKCPECGKSALKRLIGTGAGILFKGSGFYETDYRSESYKKAAEKETGGAKGTDKKPEKTETKAASTETKTDSAAAPKKKSA
ncbi:MAG: zinc ribbon domain-containing protein [Sedimentisphaerales bacterium]|nr:zinc ribbon domain-containing protein [Sedimentisphaerales bacterium]